MCYHLIDTQRDVGSVQTLCEALRVSVSGYKLYTVLDIFSRYVVGWMIAEVESSELAKQLIAETAHKQDIQPDQLTLHPVQRRII